MIRSHVYIFALTLLLLPGCIRTDEGEETNHPSGGSETIWTSTTELFMEYPALVVGQEVRFAVHLTWLSDFKAVTEGQLSLDFTSTDGSQRTTALDKPSSPGIYRPTITFDHAGTYHLTMIINGRALDTLHVGGLKVFSSAAGIPPEEAPQGEQLIGFLKEQQWKIDFRTEPVVRMRMSGTVRAAAEIIPRLNNEVIVSAPFTGTIPAERNERLPTVGSTLERGTPLAIMVPSPETPDGNENFTSRFVAAETGRMLAQQELERAKRLHAIQGISDKEYREAEVAFTRAEATYHTLSKFVESHSDGEFLDAFTIRAPLAGTIIEAHVVPGKQFNAGEPLYRIINTQAVWIRADVVSTEIGRLIRPCRAWLQVTGVSELLELNDRNGTLISVAAAIDPTTRTFPVVFEVRNPHGKLRVGMFGEVMIATNGEKEVLAIPESALNEDEGRYSVYVHVGGEEFAKRDVTPGERNGQYVEVKNNLSVGERVVTVGAYQVRLASLSSRLPAHGHEH